MPFACRVDGGRVLLSPAPMQSYPIVGAHDRRNFTACSPVRPRNCRKLDLHRFEIDCGGAKAGWLSVLAALAPWTDRPIQVRAGRMQVDMGPRYYGRASMPCVVPMPYGPRARFRPVGFYGPGLMVVPCPGGPAPRQFVSLPAGFAPVPTRLVGFTSIPDPVAQDASAPAPVAKQEPAVTSPAASAQASKQQKPGAKQIVGTGNAKQSESKLASAESEITGTFSAPSGQASLSEHQNLIGAVGLGLAALLFFSTALLLSRKRSREVQLAVPPGREPDEVRPAKDEWLPSTLGEALSVLVASPETDSELLKDLVKSLRRRCHPDHALNEDDRRVRERKLKQINVAWDIVCGKRRLRRASFRPRAA